MHNDVSDNTILQRSSMREPTREMMWPHGYQKIDRISNLWKNGATNDQRKEPL